MNFIKILLACFLLLASCTQQPPIEWDTVEGRYACMVNAVGFNDAYNAYTALSKSNRWSRVVIMVWLNDGARNGHAFTVYEYGKKIWFYESGFFKGSAPLSADMSLKEKPEELAKMVFPRLDIATAYFGEEK